MNKLNITIRREQPADYAEVYNLVKAAFLTQDHTAEPDHLEELRTKPVFIPELSLVAVTDDGTIVGQITIYHTVIDYGTLQDTQLVISPLSVLPEYFRRGVGTALIREGLKRAGGMKYKAVFLWGDPNYYSRSGFVPAYRYNIYHIQFIDKDVPFIMVLPLVENAFDGKKGIIDIF